MSRPAKFRSVQVLRFVAAALVVALHAIGLGYGAKPFEPMPYLGIFGAGVDLFFVISGFIIAQVAFLSGPRAAGPFLIDRWLRVAPLYFLSSVVLIAFFWRVIPAQSYISSFLFWPASAHGNVWPINLVGWTLCFEMMFYVATAFLLLPGPRAPKFLFLGVAYFVALGARYGLHLSWFDFLGNAIVIEFLMGVGVAFVWRRTSARATAAALAFGVLLIALVGFVGGGFIADGTKTFIAAISPLRVVMIGLPAAAIVLGAVRLESLFQGQRWAFAVYGGDASYSLYLVHPLVFTLVGNMGWPAAPLVTASGAFMAAMIVGIGVHQFVERPFQRWARDMRRSGHARTLAQAKI
jgi:exopolysaccharide production protein ExoZ